MKTQFASSIPLDLPAWRGLRLAVRVLFTLLVMMMAAACGDASSPSSGGDRRGSSDAVKIIPHLVTFQSDVIEVQAVGTARAEKAAIIKADDGGEVTSVSFEAGDTVQEGDVLLTLESAEERLAVERTRVALKDAEQLIARYKGITLPGAISDSRIDDAKIAAERARVELKLTEIALQKRQVRAPFSGTVGLTDIDAGARITPDTEITRLDDRSTLFVDFQAPEEVYGRIVAGDTINIEPFSGSGKIYQAQVHKVDSRISQNSRSFTVRAKVDNTDDSLRPGMSFKIDFQLAGKSYPVVPEAAIIWGGDGAYVWVVKEGVAKRESVTIVSRKAGQVLIRASIPEGGMVIAEGVQKVRDGAAVDFSAFEDTLPIAKPTTAVDLPAIATTP
jgi:RND family efflux transporter MFP subunit